MYMRHVGNDNMRDILSKVHSHHDYPSGKSKEHGLWIVAAADLTETEIWMRDQLG